MKRWAIIITLVYALLWLVLAYPVTCASMEYNLWLPDLLSWRQFITVEYYRELIFWFVGALAILCQGIIAFSVATGSARNRAGEKHGIFWPACVISFLAASMIYWMVLSTACLVLKEETVLAPLNEIVWHVERLFEARTRLQVSGPTIGWHWGEASVHLGFISVIWMVVAWYIFTHHWTDACEAWTRFWVGRLLRWTFVSVLILYPLHFVLKWKEYLYIYDASGISFLGIATGGTIALLCACSKMMFYRLDQAKRMRSLESESISK